MTTQHSPQVPFLARLRQHPDRVIGVLVFLLTLGMYGSTLAPGLVFGDPAEYTFVPHVWGIMHPPGYAFQTVLGGLWQRVIPFGTAAFRANLLSAVAGASIAALVYGIVRTLLPGDRGWLGYAAAALAAASTATATDIWQHSIHANAHIITALLATASLFALVRWYRTDLDDRWLFAFCVVAGVSITHHPLLAFSFPAYTVFIIVTRPRILREWRTLLKMVGFALIGLSIWLYLPIRAALGNIPFGSTNMNTLSGFLDLTLARGLRVNLFHFGLADQPARWLVFASLLRLQAGLIVIALMIVGLFWLWKNEWRVGLLATLFIGINALFVINTIQDVMAYLMVPFAALLMLSGIGAWAAIEQLRLPLERDANLLRAMVATALIALPLFRVRYLAPQVSLADTHEAQDWIDSVYGRFANSGDHAILLCHWEHLTPLWYEEYVNEHPLDESDVKLVFVATTSERPWVDNVWANIDRGPVYVSGYQRELIDAGFRLRPIGAHLYRVIPAPATEAAEVSTQLDAEAGPVTVVGVDLPQTTVAPGQKIPLVIALTADTPPSDIIFPYVTLGDVTYQFTTDSHWLTPYWEPGETILERYDFRAPFTLDAGEYPLKLGLRNLSQGGENVPFADGSTTLDLGTITIAADFAAEPATPEDLLADIDHTAGLAQAAANANGQRRVAVWNEPLVVHAGQDIHVRLTWNVLSHPDDNLKVFVHLVDSANHVIAQQDGPPLGGSFPTYLWFSKWVPGQTVIDPYRLHIPADAPPGEYRIEVGMYGFMTFQRAPFYDPEGNLSGDFFLLGPVRVEP